MRCAIAVLALAGLAASLPAQEQQSKKKKAKGEMPAQVDLVAHEAAPLFTAEQPVAFKLTANFGRLRRDKSQDAPWRAATITIADSAGADVEIPLKIKTRGIWRLNNCDFPPIRLDFAKSTVKHSLFAKLDKPKLVTHCKDSEEYEQYLLQEMQLYRVDNLLTRYSHRVRLARVMYADSASGKIVATRYAFIEEEPAELAHRVGGMIMKGQGAGPSDLDANQAAIFFIFQYLIGNTDWSVAGQHNVELITSDSGAYVPIAYDFDFSGAVNTRYAVTDSRLPIRRVRDRLYRGYCLTPAAYAPALDLFRAKKDSIYALYRDGIGGRLEGERVKQTLEYFDEFYRTIDDQRELKKQIMERCIAAPS